MAVRTRTRGAHRSVLSEPAPARRRAVRTLTAAVLGVGVAVVVATPSAATQAPGHDVVAWANGWAWTYATTFNYDDHQGTHATIDENVTYTVAGTTTFQNQPAYQVNLAGSITGGSGAANTGSFTASLDTFSGSVSGTEFIRRSDLALLQESQHQNLSAKAHASIISVGVTAVIDLTLTPNPGWKALAFPLNSGDNWHDSTDVTYSGGFSYDAGSLGGTGSSPFDGDFPVDAPASVSTQTIGVPINGSVATDLVSAASADGSTVDNQWWASAYQNVAKEHLQLPLDGATIIEDRSLSSASLPAPAATLTETITPSLTCAGDTVEVAGRLSSGASGTALTVTLDQSADTPGKQITANTTTGANGNYSTTLTTPADSDGLAKNGARAGWGVLVEGGSARSVATVVVTNLDCTSLTYTGATSGPVGTSATVSATLLDRASNAGVSGQQISFALSGGSTVTGTTNGSGVATASLPLNQQVRNATVTTSFAGSGSLTAAETTSAMNIGKDATTTSILASEPSATIGDAVTFTATVTPTVGSGPTGAVQFAVDGSNFGAPVPLSGGQATSAAISTLVLGDHTATATYLGDDTFAGSTSAAATVHVHVPLTPTTTTVDPVPPSSVYGQSVTITATVAHSGPGDPTGTVSFTDGTQALGTAVLSVGGGGDQATIETSDLAVGTHNIVATYQGDDTFDGSASAPAGTTVSPAATTTAVMTADSSTVTGQAVVYTATVSPVSPGAGVPDGSVQLNVDGVPEGAPVDLVGGAAEFPAVTDLTAGLHAVTVTYPGSMNYASSVGSAHQQVDPAETATGLMVAPSPSSEGQDVTLTATVIAQAPGTGVPTGTVTFTVDGSDIGAASLAGGQATLTTSTLAAGGHTITARFGGDPNYLASTSDAVSHTVIAGAAVAATSTTLESSVNPSTFGQLITFTATVAADDPDAGTPDGSVQFAVDGTDIGNPVALDGGVAVSPTLASPLPGDHFVSAAYLPTAAFASSGASLTQTVDNADADVALTSTDDTSDYGQSVSFHATVTSTQLGTGRPTGDVQFRVDGTALGGVVHLTADGTGRSAADSAAITTLPPGAHMITVLYTGSTAFLPASASLTQTVNAIATTTVLTSSANPSTYGQSVTFTATVAPASTVLGAPTGSVTFTDGTTTLATVPVDAVGDTAVAALTLNGLGAGPHAMRASYNGSDAFTPSTSATLGQVVQKAATSISAEAAVLRLIPLGLPLGRLRATLTSASGPVAGAPLVFKIGSLTACTVTTDADGVAVCPATKYLLNLTLALGYRVEFAGDDNHLPSTGHAGIIN